MHIANIQQLAKSHGLSLTSKMTFNEMGTDFRVGFAQDDQARDWVLRIPRRPGLREQIETEKQILELAKRHLSIEVPDWRIAAENFIAYPLLSNAPALTFDGQTHQVSWYMDQRAIDYPVSLAAALVQIHNVPEEEVRSRNIKVHSPEESRTEIADRIDRVKTELGIGQTLEKRYRKWLDNDRLWPDFTSFVHGDLYAGHILVEPEGKVTGIIDWTTAHVSDIALDFSGHFNIFGLESTKTLIREYEKQGGKVWAQLLPQVIERAAAAPLAYGFFAMETGIDLHITAAKEQLGVR